MSETEVPNPGYMFAKLLYDVGTVLLVDDFHDYGKFDHVHHWLVGEMMRQVGKHIGGAVVGLSIFNEISNKPKYKIFPLTSDDEAKLESILKTCLGAKRCHT